MRVSAGWYSASQSYLIWNWKKFFRKIRLVFEEIDSWNRFWLFVKSMKCFVKVQVVQPYNSTDTVTAWKKSHFILSESLAFSIAAKVLLQLCPVCLDCLTWMVCEMGDKWLYCCSFCGVLLLGFGQNSVQYPCVEIMYEIKLAIVVSIATTSRCRRGRYSLPWIDPLYPWSVPYNTEC